MSGLLSKENHADYYSYKYDGNPSSQSPGEEAGSIRAGGEGGPWKSNGPPTHVNKARHTDSEGSGAHRAGAGLRQVF